MLAVGSALDHNRPATQRVEVHQAHDGAAGPWGINERPDTVRQAGATGIRVEIPDCGVQQAPVLVTRPSCLVRRGGVRRAALR